MSNPTGPEVGPLQTGQTRYTTSDASTLAGIRAQIVEKSKPDSNGFIDYQSLTALVGAYKLMAGEAADTPTPINVGGGKVALFDPKTGQFTVQDVSGLTPEQKATAAAQDKADLEYKQAQTKLAEQQAAASASNVRTPEERNAGINQSNAAAEASRAQAYANSPAGIRERAQAEADAAIAIANGKVAVGAVMKEEDAKRLDAELKMIADRAAIEMKAAADKEAFDRQQPNVDRAAAQNQQQIDQNAAFQEGQMTSQRLQEQRARTEAEAKPLLEQSQSMDSLLRESAKAGVAPVAGASSLVFNPMVAAQNMLAKLNADGAVPSQFMPTVKPQAPAGAPAPTSQAGGAPAPVAPAARPLPNTAPAPGSQRNLTGGMA